jgi:hypothetical protein
MTAHLPPAANLITAAIIVAALALGYWWSGRVVRRSVTAALDRRPDLRHVPDHIAAMPALDAAAAVLAAELVPEIETWLAERSER